MLNLKAVEIAIKEIGTLENPLNSNKQKYGLSLGQNGVPWCALFCSWVMIQTGLKLPRINIAYCPAWVEWFKKMNRYHDKNSTPEPGDFVFFAFSKKGILNGWAEHVGLVEKVNKDGSITTLEGNTSSGLEGNQSNGGGVYRRVRTKTFITGYGRPFY
jgi:hypothetical protein